PATPNGFTPSCTASVTPSSWARRERFGPWWSRRRKTIGAMLGPFSICQARSLSDRLDAGSRDAGLAGSRRAPRPFGSHAHDGQERVAGDRPQPAAGAPFGAVDAAWPLSTPGPGPAAAHPAPP